MRKDCISFSIIIPIYNSERYLKTTINSVLEQTYNDFELILINDGSTENDKEICKEFARNDERIVFIDKKNEGVSKTRNLGIKKAKNNYICFLDADDYIENTMLEKYVSIIKRYKDIEMINAGFFSEIYQENNSQVDRISYKEKYYKSIDEIKMDFVLLWDKHLLYNIWNKVYSRDIIKKNRIEFPEYNWGEDIEFNRMYLMCIKNMYNTSECFYHYIRGREGTITGKYIENLYDIRLKENKEFKRYFEKFGIKEVEYKEFCARRHIERTLGCIENLFNEQCDLTLMEKYKEVKRILYDDVTREELKEMRPHSLKIKVLLIPYKFRFVFIAMIFGKILAICKKKIPKIFNKLKNKR